MPIIVNTAKKLAKPYHRLNNGQGEPDDDSDEAQGAKWLSWLIEISIIVLALLLALMVRHSIYDVAFVTSRSMEPTLNVGDRIVFDHRLSLYGQWRRGDIVFFDPPENWQNDDPSVLVKRVVALPGETVEVRQGHVFVDNNEISEGAQEDPEDSMPPLKLEGNQYFVMGDNRRNSEDSRVHGPITRDDIRGRATLRLWPSPRRLSSAR